MARPNKTVRKRLVLTRLAFLIVVIALVIRIGYIQIVQGEDLKKGALYQWTKSIDIQAKRGTIYDRNGNKLAISVSANTAWVSPADIKEPESSAKILSEILDMDEEDVYDIITRNVRTMKLKQWLSIDEVEKLREAKVPGIEIIDDNRRFYPYENFASYILGFLDADNNGAYGIERTYDKYLAGTNGKWITMTDVPGNKLPNEGERVFEAKEGSGLVLTLDESIQHFVEKRGKEGLLESQSDKISIIVMDPKNGDILALSNLPDYNPNNPRAPRSPEEEMRWANLSNEEIVNEYFDVWRNFAINDIYEPGSIFKLVTVAAALEENTASLNSHYYCGGFVRDIPGEVLRCARWYRPHGPLTLMEATNHSCNVAYIDIARKLGKENLYKYIKGFGFGEPTGIELTGEQAGIIPQNTDVIREVNLATMSYGHGVAVTPIQMASAISAMVNGGNLMTPRLVKEIIDVDGEIITSFEPQVKRQVISKETSNTILQLMESVVADGTGTNAYIPGQKVGGKTGTTIKIKDGVYVSGSYIASFVGVAPIDDPQFLVLVIADEPVGAWSGGGVCAPIGKKIMEDIFNYMNISPEFSEEEKVLYENTVEVPNVVGLALNEAVKILQDSGFKHTTESYNIEFDSVILSQFPLAGTKVIKGSIIDLYIKEEKIINEIKMPDLMGKTQEEVIEILDNLNINYNFQGSGFVVKQIPEADENITINSTVEVEFSKIKE